MTKALRNKIPSGPETDRDAALHGNQGQDQVEMSEVRLERIRAVMSEALARVDPTESALGAITSDMMDLAFRIKQALDGSLSDTANAEAQFQQLMPMIQMFMKLTGQIARYVEVQRLLGKPQ
jgi:hypothetical protein